MKIDQIMSGSVSTHTFMLQGYHMLTGSWVEKNALQIFDLRTTKSVHSLPFHVAHRPTYDYDDAGEYLYTCRYYDPDTVVAGGSGTNSLQAISVANNAVSIVTTDITGPSMW